MPLVASVFGVTNIDWTKNWVQAMKSLGVNMEAEQFVASCKALTRWESLTSSMLNRGD